MQAMRVFWTEKGLVLRLIKERGFMANKRMYIVSGGMIHCDLANMVCMPALGTAKENQVQSIWAKSPVTCMNH